MTTASSSFPADGRVLRIERVLQASRGAIWRCWTEPDLLRQWFCPRPWGVASAEMQVRPGGRFHVLMQGPGGEQVPMPGVFLAVEEGRRLVFTDAFESAWVPSGRAFMTGEVLLEDSPGGATRYVASARHWSEADREEHERMGFDAGWNAAASQLEDLARTLSGRP